MANSLTVRLTDKQYEMLLACARGDSLDEKRMWAETVAKSALRREVTTIRRQQQLAAERAHLDAEAETARVRRLAAEAALEREWPE